MAKKDREKRLQALKEDLKYTILEVNNTRVTVFPVVLEEGDIQWNGSITMPGQTIADVSFQPCREAAVSAIMGQLELYIGRLLGLAKALKDYDTKLVEAEDLALKDGRHGTSR